MKKHLVYSFALVLTTAIVGISASNIVDDIERERTKQVCLKDPGCSVETIGIPSFETKNYSIHHVFVRKKKDAP